jgi:XRE family aerobic/anaerobic benzoate catabolism transcriptional regulator
MMRQRQVNCNHIRETKQVTQSAPVWTVASADPGDESRYLAALGERVRTLRARRGMSRKVLARESGVSERYLAKLEGGEGNISVLLLRQVARALDTAIDQLVLDGDDPPVEVTHSLEVLRRLDPADLERARRWLSDTFGGSLNATRNSRIALVGLRGAGKSTIGSLLAERIGIPFVELDREVEREVGMTLAAVFDLYGQAGFRRLERKALDRAVTENPRMVLAVGGGLVSDAASYEHLLATCFTVWLRATPAEHMQRVIAQGDLRPMADNRESMADLRRILSGREPLYGKADLQLSTTERTPGQCVELLVAQLLSVATKPAK